MEKEHNEITWLKINRETKALDIYDFLNEEIPFKEVVELYRLLKYKMEWNLDWKKVEDFAEEYENN